MPIEAILNMILRSDQWSTGVRASKRPVFFTPRVIRIVVKEHNSI